MIPSWTVFENLALPWRYHDLLKKEQLEPYIHSQLLRYQEDVHLLHRVAATLTVEQRLRVAFIRAVLKDPELLFLDNDIVAFHLTRFMKAGLGQKLNEESLAMVVRGGAAMIGFFPRDRVHLAIVRNGSVLASGRLIDLYDHPNPDVVMVVKGY